MSPNDVRAGDSSCESLSVQLSGWEKLVRPYFDFLDEYGFVRATQFDRSDFWATSVVYATARHAVRVTHSVEFSRAEVEIVRLRDGAFPHPTIFYDDAAPFDQTLLDNVVLSRAPDRVADTQVSGLNKEELKTQLATWATLLRTVAADFLAGADTAFDDAKAIVRRRVEKNPQQIVVWLPDDANRQEEADAVDRARSTAPPHVDVVVRRYRR
jgi:hypothetical protein